MFNVWTRAIAALFCAAALASCSGNAELPASGVAGSSKALSSTPHEVSTATFLAREPIGTRIYQSDVVVINDGTTGEALPLAAAKIVRNQTGLHVTNTLTGQTRNYSVTATVSTQKAAMLSALPVNGVPTGALRDALQCGNAKLLETIRTAAIILPPKSGGGGDGGGSGDGGSDSGGVGEGSTGGDLDSSNDECLGGGENIGWTVDVPAQDAGATVTMCAQNSSTSVCFSWGHMSAGIHNLSGYLPGSGPASYSMGLIMGDDMDEGVGWGEDPGC